MPMPLPTSVLWDMDGTLIDQSTPIIRCYGEVIQSLGFEQPEPEAIRRSMGGPMMATMRLFIDESRLDEACRLFRERFPGLMFDGLRILTGAHACIDYVHAHGIPQAILTNKHGPTAREVSAHCDFDTKIPLCVGNTDTPWEKPQRELTEHLLSALGAPPTGGVLIGDSPTDVATAQKAGMVCLGVATGAHSTTELRAAGASEAFDNLDGLLEFLKSADARQPEK